MADHKDLLITIVTETTITTGLEGFKDPPEMQDQLLPIIFPEEVTEYQTGHPGTTIVFPGRRHQIIVLKGKVYLTDKLKGRKGLHLKEQQKDHRYNPVPRTLPG
jgi:hypothetical protein